MYGLIDFSLIDTMPGGFGAFAPPAGWQGDYRQYLQARFDGNIGARQHIVVVGRIIVSKLQSKPTEFIGPHAVEAREFALSTLSPTKRH